MTDLRRDKSLPPAICLAFVALAAEDACAQDRVTIDGFYENRVTRLRPQPKREIVAQYRVSVVLSAGNQVDESWDSTAGRTRRTKRSTRVLGGSTEETGGSWRVLAENQLQRTIDYPQNVTIITITVNDDRTCKLTTEYELKSGFTEYMFRRWASREWAYFTQPQTMSTRCSIR
jgi:hypothetical protein